MININECIAKAMKSKNQVELRAYKNLKAEIQILQTAKNAKPYDEAAEIQLISKMCKKLEDSISSFIEANREDLASEYREELEVLKKLLPEPVNESQIYAELYNHGLSVGWSEYKPNPNPQIRCGTCMVHIPKKEMGNAIKHLKARFPQADGKMISEIVKKYIV
jgi:uncharacterized protein YqeY